MQPTPQNPAIATRFRGFLPVVVDVETAGFDAKRDALLEIAGQPIANSGTIFYDGKLRTRLDAVLGHHQVGDLLEELPDFDVYVDRAQWPADWALRSYPVGKSDRKRLSDAMKAAALKEEN